MLYCIEELKQDLFLIIEGIVSFCVEKCNNSPTFATEGLQRTMVNWMMCKNYAIIDEDSNDDNNTDIPFIHSEKMKR